jgi:hypothetical protein
MPSNRHEKCTISRVYSFSRNCRYRYPFLSLVIVAENLKRRNQLKRHSVSDRKLLEFLQFFRSRVSIDFVHIEWVKVTKTIIFRLTSEIEIPRTYKVPCKWANKDGSAEFLNLIVALIFREICFQRPTLKPYRYHETSLTRSFVYY